MRRDEEEYENAKTLGTFPAINELDFGFFFIRLVARRYNDRNEEYYSLFPAVIPKNSELKNVVRAGQSCCPILQFFSVFMKKSVGELVITGARLIQDTITLSFEVIFRLKQTFMKFVTRNF